MKKIAYIFLLFSIVMLASCSDDDEKRAGNPTMGFSAEFNSAFYGDSLPFTIKATDGQVPLSTLKARLYFGEEKVSELILRTKTDGDYSGKLYVPFLKGIPDGKAKLEFVLQNINFTITQKEFELSVKRPVYPYVTLVAEGKEYEMVHTTGFNYELTAELPQKIKGYIRTPKAGANGNELTFGWEENEIALGSTTPIPFSNLSAGEYTISLNTFDYHAAPFITAYTINGEAMKRIDDEHFRLDLNLTQDQEVVVEGIEGFKDWWIDPDFFNKNDGGQLLFKPITGSYRIVADFKYKYLKVEVLNDGKEAELKADGTGAIWIIGDSQGKPTKALTGWNPDIALCMAPMGNGIYVTTFVAGQTIKADNVNFVFFHVKGWWPSFNPDNMTVQSDIVRMGTGSVASGGNGIDRGNIALAEGKKLTVGKSYLFKVDVSAGVDKAVLTVEEK